MSFHPEDVQNLLDSISNPDVDFRTTLLTWLQGQGISDDPQQYLDLFSHLGQGYVGQLGAQGGQALSKFLQPSLEASGAAVRSGPVARAAFRALPEAGTSFRFGREVGTGGLGLGGALSGASAATLLLNLSGDTPQLTDEEQRTGPTPFERGASDFSNFVSEMTKLFTGESTLDFSTPTAIPEAITPPPPSTEISGNRGRGQSERREAKKRRPTPKPKRRAAPRRTTPRPRII